MLATKVHFPMSADPNARGNSRRWIVREVEASLRRLRTDYIDLYQIHRPDPDTDIEETLSALSDLVRSGKVRAIGSSTFPAEQIVEAQWVAERRGYVRFRCEDLIKLAADAGHSLTHLALAFVSANPAITSVIIGPRTMDQLTDLLAGATATLDDAVLDQIDQIVPPGATLNAPDAGWLPPTITNPATRRRPVRDRTAS